MLFTFDYARDGGRHNVIQTAMIAGAALPLFHGEQKIIFVNISRAFHCAAKEYSENNLTYCRNWVLTLVRWEKGDLSRSAFGVLENVGNLRDETSDFCVPRKKKKATEKRKKNNKNISQNPFLQHIERMYSLFKIIIHVYTGAPESGPRKINIIIAPSSIS